MSTKGIYKFHWHCGRMGDLHSVFVATDEDVAAAIGKKLYFGEVLGKHSEIAGTLEAKDVKLVSDKPEAVSLIEELGLRTGLNPLNYFDDQDEEGDE